VVAGSAEAYDAAVALAANERERAFLRHRREALR
jgi:predicted RNA polymerase sigma factor